MVKIASTALSLLLLACTPGFAADTDSDTGTINTMETNMSAKKDDSAKNARSKGKHKKIVENVAEGAGEISGGEPTMKNAGGKTAEKETSGGKSASGGREEAGWVYHLSQAKWHTTSLKENAMVKLAHAIEERGWTQAKAAEFLGVNQPRISDLMRGQSGKFTLDSLIEMLYALDKPVTLVIEDKRWDVSNSSPVSSKDDEAAIAFYTDAIKLDPKKVNSYFKRAAAYSRLQKYDLAIGDYTRCIELEPNVPGARSNRAMCYSADKQYKAAIQECDEIEKKFPDYNVYQNRGIIYFDMGEYDKALADYSKAVQMDPQRPGPWWNRAKLYEKLGKFNEAISDYQSTLKADPTYKVAQERIDELKKKKI